MNELGSLHVVLGAEGDREIGADVAPHRTRGDRRPRRTGDRARGALSPRAVRPRRGPKVPDGAGLPSVGVLSCERHAVPVGTRRGVTPCTSGCSSGVGETDGYHASMETWE